MSSNLPTDPILCLSIINTKLRDYYKTLDDLCQDLDIDKEALICKLQQIDYEYDSVRNQFI